MSYKIFDWGSYHNFLSLNSNKKILVWPPNLEELNFNGNLNDEVYAAEDFEQVLSSTVTTPAL